MIEPFQTVPSADLDLGIGNKGVRGKVEILRRGSLPDAPGAVVLGAVARAEPAVVIAFVRQRNAAQMRANADDDEPLLVAGLHALRVRLGISQRLHVDVLGELDVVRRAMEDEDRLGTPEHLDDPSQRDRRQIYLDWGSGRDRGRVRIHLIDQRHQRGCSADGRDCAGGYVQEVAARVLRRRHGRHVLFLSPCWLMSSARGVIPREESLGGRGGPDAAALPGRQDGASAGFYWHPCRESASPLCATAAELHKSLADITFTGPAGSAKISNRSSRCGSPFTSRTSRKIPAPSCG